MKLSRLMVLPPLLAMAACVAPDETPTAFGDAVRHNMAVQLVNPAPPAAAAELPENDGARAGRAMQRYQEYKVFPPVLPTSAGAATSGADQR